MLRRLPCLMWLCVSALASPRAATAGAFLLPEGEGQFIAGVGYSEASRRFDPSGVAVTAPAYRKAEASGYLEYGVTPWLGLVLAPTLAHANATPATNAITGSDESAIGARLQLYGAPGRVLAVQVLFEPPVWSSHAATDLRLMLGQAFTISRWPVFVDLEPGFRARAGPYPIEARLDVTVGVRPIPKLMILMQDFSSFAHSAGPTLPRQSYSKLQVSTVYDLSRIWSVQIGAFRTLSGRNALREMGPLAAIWYRF